MTPHLALVLGGGGARGAYQAGVLRWIARHYPDLSLPILVGVSAGAVNTTHLAARGGSLRDSVDELARLWLSLTPERVFRADAASLVANVLRWGTRLLSGGAGEGESIRGLVDTSPLRAFLLNALHAEPGGPIPGVAANVERGVLQALALSATSYTTGRATTWVQGRAVTLWERPQRQSLMAAIGVDHVMASTALPLLFPAARVGDEWYGDGGIRLTAPLSPALHLGASRILTVATRYDRSRAEAAVPAVRGYPPPAQVLSVLYNAIFLDLVDQDVLRLQLMNDVLRRLPAESRGALRVVDILVVRPSLDLGRLAREYEPRLPKTFRFLTRGLGTRRTASPDILSLVMFQPDYLERLIALGDADADANAERIDRFLASPAEP